MNFQVNSTYSFQCYAPSILKSSFNKVVILGVMAYRMARQFRDVDAVHRQVYPLLPAGSLDDPTKYSYVQIQYPNGTTDIIGIPWINADTVQLVNQISIIATIDNVTPTDADRIRNALIQNGFNAVSIKIV